MALSGGIFACAPFIFSILNFAQGNAINDGLLCNFPLIFHALLYKVSPISAAISILQAQHRSITKLNQAPTHLHGKFLFS